MARDFEELSAEKLGWGRQNHLKTMSHCINIHTQSASRKSVINSLQKDRWDQSYNVNTPRRRVCTFLLLGCNAFHLSSSHLTVCVCVPITRPILNDLEIRKKKCFL